MHELRTLSRAFAAASLLLGCTAANALVTYIDEFHIVRGDPSTNFFVDTFSDNILPPVVPGAFTCGTPPSSNCYFFNGTFNIGDESDGKLRLNTAQGILTASSEGVPRILQSVRLLSNRSEDPADAGRGLKKSLVFSASVLYDFVIPGPGEQMQIRLNDTHEFATDTGHRTDYLALSVRRAETAGALPQIRFFEQNFAAGTLVELASTELNTGLGADQIRLTLTHGVAGSTEITASWEYLQGGVSKGVGSFATTPGNIFDGETFTRAEFGVSAPVPEPETYAMMLIGVGLVGWQLRRRARRGLALA